MSAATFFNLRERVLDVRVFWAFLDPLLSLATAMNSNAQPGAIVIASDYE